ncbi:hypothetical protein GJ496_003652 [Pomphorhynchus laevis]|nr:hypothetical protein GJ496_003652 [Pomphorhynchus laevis]
MYQQPSTTTYRPKDTTFTKIFVGGLSYHSTDETLRKYFERFGDIDEAVVITDRQTGKSKGYGFVTMNTRESAGQAVCDPNPVIDGRKANVNLAYLGAKPRTMPSSPGLIPIQITNAYQTLANASYGLQPICYQAAPAQHQFISSQPNILLSAANPNVLATAAGSILDLAIQNSNSPAICQAAQISLIEAAVAANRGLSVPQATTLYAEHFNQPISISPSGLHQQFAWPSTVTHAGSHPYATSNGLLNNGIAAAHQLQYPTTIYDRTAI